MAGRRFAIESPEALDGISRFRTEGSLTSYIRVWTVGKRIAAKQGRQCRWDSAFYAYFSGDKKREAAVRMTDERGETVECCALKYNKALEWCKEHLKEAEA